MSLIEWTDVTWNPITGCTKLSPGCAHCYAERMAKLLRGCCGYPVDDPFQVTLHPDRLGEPLKWKKRRRVVVCSMSDLFHWGVPDDFINRVVATITMCPHLTFEMCTKRSERMEHYFNFLTSYDILRCARLEPLVADSRLTIPSIADKWPPANLWLGASIEDQERADERIPHLVRTSAAVRFLSCEPLLGPIDLSQWTYPNSCGCLEPDIDVSPDDCPHCKSTGAVCPFDWLIVGGESGPGARAMKLEWARSIIEQCRAAGVPVFVKQLGGSRNKRNDPGMWPDDLRVREYPHDSRRTEAGR